MFLVDVHCHLDHSRFSKDLDKVIDNSRKAGVKHIITSGVNVSTNRIVLDLVKKYPDIVKASFGLYPIDALAVELGEDSGFSRDLEPMDVDKELAWISAHKNDCVAVGEVGLDYHLVKGKEKEQKAVFQKVISTVEKMKKPMVIHSRKAELDCVEMVESSSLKKVVWHCFTGKKSLVKRIADHGWYFSIPPIICKLQQFQIMAEIVNINQLLTETDSPYLGPIPGERNEPRNVLESVKKIASMKGFTVDETAQNIFFNYQNMFG